MTTPPLPSSVSRFAAQLYEVTTERPLASEDVAQLTRGVLLHGDLEPVIAAAAERVGKASTTLCVCVCVAGATGVRDYSGDFTACLLATLH